MLLWMLPSLMSLLMHEFFSALLLMRSLVADLVVVVVFEVVVCRLELC